MYMCIDVLLLTTCESAAYVYVRVRRVCPSVFGRHDKAEYEAFRAVDEADHLAFVASGNYGCNIDGQGQPGPTNCPSSRSSCCFTPAAYSYAGIVTVGASDAVGKRAKFSTYGKESVDVFAPGVDIVTLQVNGDKQLFVKVRGTSFASPLVAGIAAYIWSLKPEATRDELKALLISTVNKSPSLEELCVSGGVVDAYAALMAFARKHNMSLEALPNPPLLGPPFVRPPVRESDATGKFHSTLRLVLTVVVLVCVGS
eukprot:GHVU01155335.1.p1 GENE.GHVU01155335.1~~GHVU01155335.1.p1  ORF type:complete len:256 (+),score=39.19 GHVU01155335.1:351-1118(+)